MENIKVLCNYILGTRERAIGSNRQTVSLLPPRWETVTTGDKRDERNTSRKEELIVRDLGLRSNGSEVGNVLALARTLSQIRGA